MNFKILFTISSDTLPVGFEAVLIGFGTSKVSKRISLLAESFALSNAVRKTSRKYLLPEATIDL